MPKRAVDPSYNFAAMFPNLLDEWDTSVNTAIGISATKVSPYSDKRVHWTCRTCAHKWQAQIKNRTKKKSGCPACSPVGKAANSSNSLASLFPSIADTWHPTKNGSLTPSDVRYASKKEVYWQCSDYPEHVFKQGIGKRTAYGKPTCMICTRRLITPETALTASHPELIAEWDFEKNQQPPDTYSAGSIKKVWWRCSRFPDEHRWEATIKNRVNGSRCRFCNNQGSEPEMRLLTELEVLFPSIQYRERLQGIEVDLYLPEERIAIEYDGSFWHRDAQSTDRKKNDELKALGVDIIRVRHAPLEKLGVCDIVVSRPELSKSDLNQVVRMITQLRSSLSESEIENYLQSPSFKNDDEFIAACARIPGVWQKHNAATKAPELRALWSDKNEMRLEDFSHGSHKKAWWICKDVDTHPDYLQPIKSKVSGLGCPYCTGKLVAPEKSFGFKFPDLVADWDTEKNQLSPYEVTYGSKKRIWWKCSACNHCYQATPNNKGNAKTACPACSKLRIRQQDLR